MNNMNENLFHQNIVAVFLIIIGLIKAENWVENDFIPQFPFVSYKEIGCAKGALRSSYTDRECKQWTILYGLFALMFFVSGWAWFIHNDPAPDTFKYIGIGIILASILAQYSYKCFYTQDKYILGGQNVYLNEINKTFVVLLYILWIIYVILKSLRYEDKKDSETGYKINHYAVGCNILGLLLIGLGVYMYFRLRRRNVLLSSWWKEYYLPFTTTYVFICFGYVLLAIGNSII